jgi:hypothetical protein
MQELLLRGFPSSTLSNQGRNVVAVDNTISNKSKALEVTTNETTVLVPAKEGVTYFVKGITVICAGNQGLVEVRGTIDEVNTLLLPTYVSVQGRNGASGALNIKLDANTPITFTTSGRGDSRTFVGVSYVEVGATEDLEYMLLLDAEGNPIQTVDGKDIYMKVGV